MTTHLMMFRSSDMMVVLLTISVIFYMYDGYLGNGDTSDPLNTPQPRFRLVQLVNPTAAPLVTLNEIGTIVTGDIITSVMHTALSAEAAQDYDKRISPSTNKMRFLASDLHLAQSELLKIYPKTLRRSVIERPNFLESVGNEDRTNNDLDPPSYLAFVIQTVMLVISLAFYTAVEVCKHSWLCQTVLPPIFVGLAAFIFPLIDCHYQGGKNLKLPVGIVDSIVTYLFTGFPVSIIFLLVLLSYASNIGIGIAIGKHTWQVVADIAILTVAQGCGIIIYFRSYLLAMDLLYTECYAFQAVRNLPYIHELELQSINALESQYKRTIEQLNQQMLEQYNLVSKRLNGHVQFDVKPNSSIRKTTSSFSSVERISGTMDPRLLQPTEKEGKFKNHRKLQHEQIDGPVISSLPINSTSAWRRGQAVPANVPPIDIQQLGPKLPSKNIGPQLVPLIPKLINTESVENEGKKNQEEQQIQQQQEEYEEELLQQPWQQQREKQQQKVFSEIKRSASRTMSSSHTILTLAPDACHFRQSLRNISALQLTNLSPRVPFPSDSEEKIQLTRPLNTHGFYENFPTSRDCELDDSLNARAPWKMEKKWSRCCPDTQTRPVPAAKRSSRQFSLIYSKKDFPVYGSDTGEKHTINGGTSRSIDGSESKRRYKRVDSSGLVLQSLDSDVESTSLTPLYVQSSQRHVAAAVVGATVARSITSLLEEGSLESHQEVAQLSSDKRRNGTATLTMQRIPFQHNSILASDGKCLGKACVSPQSSTSLGSLDSKRCTNELSEKRKVILHYKKAGIHSSEQPESISSSQRPERRVSRLHLIQSALRSLSTNERGTNTTRTEIVLGSSERTTETTTRTTVARIAQSAINEQHFLGPPPSRKVRFISTNAGSTSRSREITESASFSNISGSHSALSTFRSEIDSEEGKHLASRIGERSPPKENDEPVTPSSYDTQFNRITCFPITKAPVRRSQPISSLSRRRQVGFCCDNDALLNNLAPTPHHKEQHPNDLYFDVAHSPDCILLNENPHFTNASLTDHVTSTNPDTVYSQVMQHFARMLVNQVRTDIRSYRRLGTLGTPQANQEWRLMLWAFRPYLERDEVITGTRQVLYGVQGWLPFQQNPLIPKLRRTFASRDSRFDDDLNYLDHNNKHPKAENFSHYRTEKSLLQRHSTTSNSRHSSGNRTMIPSDSACQNGWESQPPSPILGTRRKFFTGPTTVFSATTSHFLLESSLNGDINTNQHQYSDLNNGLMLISPEDLPLEHRGDRPHPTRNTRGSDNIGVSNRQRRKTRFLSAPPLRKKQLPEGSYTSAPERLIQSKRGEQESSNSRVFLKRATSFGSPLLNFKKGQDLSKDDCTSPSGLKVSSYSRVPYDFKTNMSTHQKAGRRSAHHYRSQRNSTPTVSRSDPTSKLTSKESIGSAATANSSQSEVIDGTTDILFKFKRKLQRVHRRFRRWSCRVWFHFINKLEEKFWIFGEAFGFHILKHFLTCSKFVLDLASWNSRPLMPEQKIISQSFINPDYERWFLDWARGAGIASQHMLIGIQLLGTLLNLVLMAVCVVWSHQTPNPAFAGSTTIRHYAYLIPIFVILDLMLVLCQLIPRGADHIHIVNQLSILVIIERAVISIVTLGLSTKLSTSDTVVYGQVTLNLLLAPLGLSLCSTLPRLYFLVVTVSSNAVLLGANWTNLSNAGGHWLRMNIAFLHVALFIYLLYLRPFLCCSAILRSQDDGRRRIFCLCGLPYLIQLTDIAKKEDGCGFHVSLSLSMPPANGRENHDKNNDTTNRHVDEPTAIGCNRIEPISILRKKGFSRKRCSECLESYTESEAASGQEHSTSFEQHRDYMVSKPRQTSGLNLQFFETASSGISADTSSSETASTPSVNKTILQQPGDAIMSPSSSTAATLPSILVSPRTLHILRPPSLFSVSNNSGDDADASSPTEPLESNMRVMSLSSNKTQGLDNDVVIPVNVEQPMQVLTEKQSITKPHRSDSSCTNLDTSRELLKSSLWDSIEYTLETSPSSIPENESGTETFFKRETQHGAELSMKPTNSFNQECGVVRHEGFITNPNLFMTVSPLVTDKSNGNACDFSVPNFSSEASLSTPESSISSNSQSSLFSDSFFFDTGSTSSLSSHTVSRSPMSLTLLSSSLLTALCPPRFYCGEIFDPDSYAESSRLKMRTLTFKEVANSKQNNSQPSTMLITSPRQAILRTQATKRLSTISLFSRHGHNNEIGRTVKRNRQRVEPMNSDPCCSQSQPSCGAQELQFQLFEFFIRNWDAWNGAKHCRRKKKKLVNGKCSAQFGRNSFSNSRLVSFVEWLQSQLFIHYEEPPPNHHRNRSLTSRSSSLSAPLKRYRYPYSLLNCPSASGFLKHLQSTSKNYEMLASCLQQIQPADLLVKFIVNSSHNVTRPQNRIRITISESKFNSRKRLSRIMYHGRYCHSQANYIDLASNILSHLYCGAGEIEKRRAVSNYYRYCRKRYEAIRTVNDGHYSTLVDSEYQKLKWFLQQ